MKCAKCGHEVPVDAVDCPHCAAGGDMPPVSPENGGENPDGGQNMLLRCPVCGSHRIRITSGDYSLGWGCLGTLLFGWLGLLLGLLGLGNSEAVCGNCGFRAPLNKAQASGSGCGCLLVLLVILLFLLYSC